MPENKTPFNRTVNIEFDTEPPHDEDYEVEGYVWEYNSMSRCPSEPPEHFVVIEKCVPVADETIEEMILEKLSEMLL